ncbi:hypothetical protein MKW92_004279 [Papaver armeniacum]|nr:hypothetical protein MKW92_004279 [Papaver armeniacum]
MGLLLVFMYTVLAIVNADKGAFIGVNIGTTLSDMPNPSLVASLLALAKTRIHVIVSIPNDKLLAIAVGSEIFTVYPNAAPHLVSALKHLHNSPLHSLLRFLDSFPPSQAFFNRSWDPVLVPMLKFLQQTGSYLMLNVYPYYDYMQPKDVIPLDYALFRPLTPSKDAVDSNIHLHYTNVFDSVIDAAYFSMAYLNITNVPIIVTESFGHQKVMHPSRTPPLIMQIRVAVSTYLYELYNEDMRPGSVSRRIKHSMKMVCQIYFMRLTGTGSLFASDTTYKTYCIARDDADRKILQAALDWTCGQGKIDCSSMFHGQPCYEPNTVAAHASVAFNMYCYLNGMGPENCNFKGVASITTTDPSHGSCLYPGSMDGVVTNGTSIIPDNSLGATLDANVFSSCALLFGCFIFLQVIRI